MTDREKFEAAWNKVMGTPVCILEKMRIGEKYKPTTHDFLNAAYEIWQAALASQQPAEDGWIEWAGGECPVHPETLVEIKMRNGATDGPGKAGGFVWYVGNDVRDEMGCDIIAYRVVKP